MTVTRDTDAATADALSVVDSLLLPDGIYAVFQPLARAADGVIIGYEALARSTQAPTMPPNVWLAAAEERGVRVEVELACLAAAAEAGPPPDDALLFVNVSPDVALRPELPELSRRLPRHVIEVTEHAEVTDYGPLVERLRALRAQGSLVAVDDVGAGYASMAHVLQLGPSFVKIDRSLIEGLHRDPRRRALVEALQAFASAIGAMTVAEGVETEAELAELRTVGVDLVQGYLIAHPSRPWARLSPRAQRALTPLEPLREATGLGELSIALASARTTSEACELVSRFIAHHGGLLPSVYLERGGVLRCQSRRGQWLVMDGLQPRTGITGMAFADNAEVLSADVLADSRYRMAVPGVRSEIAVPLRANGRAVGVLNVDALAPLRPGQCDLIRSCARLLEGSLAALARKDSADSTLQRLSRLGPTLAQAGSAEDLALATVRAIAELTECDSGCVWTFEDGAPRILAVSGPGHEALTGLDHEQVLALRDLTTPLSSCYSGGTDLSLEIPPTDVLRRRGARGVILVPIRDGWRLTDVLAMTSASSAFVAPDVMDAVEALCLQAGSRLAALRRVAELEDLAHRDGLTGLGNRGLWNLVLADADADASGQDSLWLALADVDRFKQVNDTHGHVVGDQVLCTLAGLFDALPGWEAYRLGGDEFALLGPAREAGRCSELEVVAHAAHAVLAPYGASLSIGAVRTSRAAIARSVDLADRALYRRKHEGGQGVTLSADVPTPRAEVAGRL